MICIMLYFVKFSTLPKLWQSMNTHYTTNENQSFTSLIYTLNDKINVGFILKKKINLIISYSLNILAVNNDANSLN